MCGFPPSEPGNKNQIQPIGIVSGQCALVHSLWPHTRGRLSSCFVPIASDQIEVNNRRHRKISPPQMLKLHCSDCSGWFFQRERRASISLTRSLLNALNQSAVFANDGNKKSKNEPRHEMIRSLCAIPTESTVANVHYTGNAGPFVLLENLLLHTLEHNYLIDGIVIQ